MRPDSEVRRPGGPARWFGDIRIGVVGAVAAAAQVTTEGVAESQRTSEELARMSHEVQTLVAGFRV